MKSNRPAVNAYRKKVVKNIGVDTLRPHKRHGETLIPAGSSNATIELPETENTFTYEVINSDAMTGDINISVDNGNLKGLVLNTSRGQLRIDPVASGTKSVTLGNQMKDGSHMNMVSDGSDWFIWSYGIGNGFASSTIGRSGTSGGNGPNSTGGGVTYAPVVIDTITTTADYPSGPAENDLTFNGTAEPNATLKVFDSVPTQVDTVTVGADGRWTWEVYDLANGEHSYTFEAFVGGTSINKASTWTDTVDGGSVTFNCSLVEIEVGTAAPDFVSLPTILAPDGTTAITPTVNSTTYSDSLAEDATFTVTFDYSYLTNSYQRTVNGVVVNRINPAIPTITTVGGETSGVAINTTTVDIVGTALPNAVVEVYIDGQTSSFASTTADGTGAWTISSHDFGWTASQTVIIKAQQQTANGSLWSNPSNDFTVNYELQTLAAPTIEINGFANNAFTNQSNPFTVQGTGTNGATIVLNGATDNNPPTVVAGGTWSTTANLNHDVTHTITAQATAVAGYGDSQQSNSFTLNVDRTSPSIATVSDETLYLGSVSDTLPTATDSFTAFGNTVTVTSDTTVDNNLAEGDHTITYTATDAAGNTATSSRIITVTTEVIVPVITSVTDNGDGTARVQGTVTGTYADNLTVQVLVDGVNSGSPVSVSSNSFDVTVSSLTTGTYSFTAKTINSESEESAESIPLTENITAPVDTTPPVITITTTESESYSISFTIQGTIDDLAATLTSGSDTITINGDGTWEYDVTLTEDQLNSFTFTAEDAVGNTSTATFEITHVPPLFLEDDANTSGDLDIDPTYSSYVYYHTDGTLIHDVGSGVSSGGVASIPVSLLSNTNTPNSIAYSIWFYLDPSSTGQLRILKGTSGGSPSHLYSNGPGIVWHAGGGDPYLREASSGITGGAPVNTHPDGSDANTFYPPASSNLARSAWHHVIVQHEWDSANTRWLTNVFINGEIATDKARNEVSNVHIDSDNTNQSILDPTTTSPSKKFNYLVSSKGTQIDSYNVVINPSASITAAIASTIYSDSTRQTGILDAIQQNS